MVKGCRREREGMVCDERVRKGKVCGERVREGETGNDVW